MKRSGKGPRLGEVNRAAKAADVDRKTIQRYLKEGLPIGPAGKIKDRDVQAFKNRKAATLKGGVVITKERDQWSTRKERAQALKLEKELAEQIGELVNRDEMIREVVNRELEFKDRLLGRWPELARKLVGKGLREIEALGRASDCEVLRCLARKGTEPNGKDGETEAKKK